MPIFVCTATAGQLTPALKTEIAQTITTIYREVIGAPGWLVQVIFYDIEPANHYVAGRLEPSDRILIRCDTRDGKTNEQRSRMAQRINEDVSRATGAPEEAVTVLLCELPAANIVEYGRLSPPAGEEDAWFSSLSATVQERLRSLG
jgi:phenylpyruvate tautomerase PptA (4-oxalocrotonate tautomerase family)